MIENTEAWQDFNYRLTQLRNGTLSALERGAVDSHGRTHETEQRALLYVLDQIIGYVPGIKRDHELMTQTMAADEARSGQDGLYGQDVLQSLTSDS